jgi:hypothetical protein
MSQKDQIRGGIQWTLTLVVIVRLLVSANVSPEKMRLEPESRACFLKPLAFLLSLTPRIFSGIEPNEV